MSRTRIYTLFAIVMVALIGATFYLLTQSGPGGQPGIVQRAGPKIGGAFTMMDTKGRVVSEADLRGKPTIIFFGFTNCPVVCPTTLLEMTELLEVLGPDAERINSVFVSVDPERDTPEVVADYLDSFDSRIRGLTGTVEQVAQMAKAYRVYYKKVPLEDGDYTVDHTAIVYLFDRDGEFSSPLNLKQEPAKAAEPVRKLLAAN